MHKFYTKAINDRSVNIEKSREESDYIQNESTISVMKALHTKN